MCQAFFQLIFLFFSRLHAHCMSDDTEATPISFRNPDSGISVSLVLHIFLLIPTTAGLLSTNPLSSRTADNVSQPTCSIQHHSTQDDVTNSSTLHRNTCRVISSRACAMGWRFLGRVCMEFTTYNTFERLCLFERMISHQSAHGTVTFKCLRLIERALLTSACMNFRTV